MESKIKIDGQQYTAGTTTPDRLFRDAWAVNGGPAIILNLERLIPIAQVQVNEWRDIRNEDPIQFVGYWFDCDEESKSAKNVAGAAAVATLDMITGRNQFSVQWSTHFDQEVAFNAELMTGLGITMAQRTSQLYVTARRMKRDIAAASTVTEVLAILNSRDTVWPPTVPTL